MDFTDALRDILSTRGTGVLDNQKLFAALLMDLCPKRKKEREMISILFKEGVMEQIKVYLFRSPEEKNKYSKEVYIKLKKGIFKDNDSLLQMYNEFLLGIGWSKLEEIPSDPKPNKQVKPYNNLPVIGDDITRKLFLTTEEAIRGCIKALQVGKKIVKVTVPANSYDGKELIIYGQGSAGLNGGKNGDLYITFVVDKDRNTPKAELQSIDGKDIKIDLFMSAEEAKKNSVRKFSINGKVFEVTIPEGIKDGQSIVLRGRGEEGINGGKNGDFYICIKMPQPSPLGKEKKKRKGFFTNRSKNQK